jgi:hypothetical protein
VMLGHIDPNRACRDSLACEATPGCFGVDPTTCGGPYNSGPCTDSLGRKPWPCIGCTGRCTTGNPGTCGGPYGT